MKNLSLGGCGFMGIYHVGVVKAFQERKPEYLTQIAGTSCGALVGAAVLSGCSLDKVANIFFELSKEGRSHMFGPLNPYFDLPGILRNLLEKTLPENAHELCTGRLYVSMTRSADTKSILTSKFETREDLIQALLCSSFVPVYSGLTLPVYKGESYYDGCWSDNNPSIDGNSLTVAPFMGESDICPKKESGAYHLTDFQNTSVLWCFENVNRSLKVFFPPDTKLGSEIYYMGYRDGITYLKSLDFQSMNGRIQVDFQTALKKDLETKEKSEFCVMMDLNYDRPSSVQSSHKLLHTSFGVLVLVLSFFMFLIYNF